MILAGDIGGTKTLLALYDDSGGTLSQVREEIYRSGDFSSLEEMLRRFLARAPRVALRAACVAVAGPVIDGRSKTTNLPWELDEGRLASALSSRVRLLNDLEGAAHGLLSVDPGQLEAILVRAGGRYHVVASEGGHADFAPRTDLEIGLLRYLRNEYGRVSYERVLSGPGLHNVYRFLRDSGFAAEPEWLRKRLAAGDPSAAIAEVALAAGHPLCAAALELFVSVYGAEAGNLALKALALGCLPVCAPGVRERLLTFVVAGGGFAGVETVAAVNDFVRQAVAFYPHLSGDLLRVVLVHPGPVILPELSEALGVYAQKKLAERKVEVRVNTRVTMVSDVGVELSDGTVIGTDIRISCNS